MRDTDFWEQFLCTGKVEDYLKYRFEEEREEERNVTAAYGGRSLEAEHAGSGLRDGNGVKADARGGVRPEDHSAH